MRKHAAELCVFGDHLRECGKASIVSFVDRWHEVAVQARHEHVRVLRERLERPRAAVGAEDCLEHVVDRLIGLAHDHRVDERSERQRIAERQGPPATMSGWRLERSSARGGTPASSRD